jgi:cobalt-zinc-cadmium efflux system protein
VSALLFRHGHRDTNVRAAFAHLAADAVLALGVVVAGILIFFTGWLWLDPVVSLVLSVAIVVGTWSLLKESLALALHAVPPSIDPAEVRAFLHETPGVIEVHDLHIWAISTSDTALTAHLVMPGALNPDAQLRSLQEELRHRFRISHSTLQVETGGLENCCALEPGH